jgi:hypothetical protein
MHQPIHRLGGIRICVQPDTHRTLPAEVCPGVPWPPGFKEEIDAWMRSFFKPINMVKDGEVLVQKRDGIIHVNPRTWERLKAAAAAGEV